MIVSSYNKMSHLYKDSKGSGDYKNAKNRSSSSSSRSKSPVKNGFRTSTKDNTTGKKNGVQRKRVVYIDDSDSSSSSSGTPNSDADNIDDESAGSESWNESNCSSGGDSFEDVQPTKRSRSLSRENNKNKKRKDESSQSEEEEYSVEKILSMQEDIDGKQWFLIKWWNYGSADNTWEPIENLSKCQDMVKKFLRQWSNKKSITMEASIKKVLNLKSHTAQGNVPKNSLIENGVSSSPYKSITCNKLKQKPAVKMSKLEKEQPHTKTSTVEDSISTNDSSSVGNKHKSSSKTATNVEAKSPPVEPFPPIKVYPAVVELIQKEKIWAIYPSGSLYYFKIINGDKLDYLLIDYTKPMTEADANDYYKCVVTEDLTGKEVKLLYGATRSVDGNIFCLVQFEGHSYVEVIPPESLFQKYPSFRRYFEVHCPHLFST